jgi:hypothetical protein
MYILATEPALFSQFYDKLKNDPGWTVHTLSCTHFIQLEMPDELTAILLNLIAATSTGTPRIALLKGGTMAVRRIRDRAYLPNDGFWLDHGSRSSP